MMFKSNPNIIEMWENINIDFKYCNFKELILKSRPVDIESPI